MSLTLTAAVRRNRPRRNVLKIEAGTGGQSISLQKNGILWIWGSNLYGQIGNRSPSNVQTKLPTSIYGAVKTFCEISAADHSVALDKNGKVWSWGRNGTGRLGDGTTTAKCTPVSVAGANKTFCKISAGTGTLAIDKNGRAWGWGGNYSGSLGDNTTVSRLTPVSVAGAVKTFCKISMGAQHSSAIDKNGRAWGWGGNYSGNLGDNTTTQRNTPVSVLGVVKTFCEIAAGAGFSIAIDKNGKAWGWGSNYHGNLGDNTNINRSTPVAVCGNKTFCKISADYLNRIVLAIDKNGRAWGWGYNNNGMIGDGTITSRRTPVSVAGSVKTFCEISAGRNHSLAIDKNGRAWAWGLDGSGALGVNVGSYYNTPAKIHGNKTFCQISAKVYGGSAIDKNGTVWSWGLNNSGQIGDNTITSKLTPVSIAGASKTFCKIAYGDYHMSAIDKNGRAWGWGYNLYGQVGNNTTTSVRTPVSILGAVKTFCEIGAGANHSVAIDKNGRAWGWGRNYAGVVGDNSITQRNTPVSVAGAVKTFCKISVGWQHSLAIDKNGRAWGWGRNYAGSLGDNTVTSRLTPVSVAGAVKTFCKISAGQFFSVAIDKNGRAWAWGRNNAGNLGDNSLTSRFTPVSVLGAVKTFCEIQASRLTVVAIDKNGRAWAWGDNSNGAVGDGTSTSRRTPVSVAGAVKTFCKIQAGKSVGSFYAIDKNGIVWAWGNTIYGAIGNDTDTLRLTPVRVCDI